MDLNAICAIDLASEDSNVVDIDSIRVASRARARSTSLERRQQLRTEGRCVRCGSHDHWVKDCLLQPFTKKQTQELARIDSRKATALGSGPGKVTIAALCDDAYDDDEWPGCLDDPEHPDA